MIKRLSVTVMILTLLSGLFGCNKSIEKNIDSVEAMTLTLRGMRGGTVYRFETETARTELCRYREVYNGDEALLRLEKSTECSYDTLIGLMNTCGVIRWNGFSGAHPKNVKDGIMFRFEATVNGGQTIHAEGSANFPKGYHEFVRSLDAMLAEQENDGN